MILNLARLAWFAKSQTVTPSGVRTESSRRSTIGTMAEHKQDGNRYWAVCNGCPALRLCCWVSSSAILFPFPKKNIYNLFHRTANQREDTIKYLPSSWSSAPEWWRAGSYEAWIVTGTAEMRKFSLSLHLRSSSALSADSTNSVCCFFRVFVAVTNERCYINKKMSLNYRMPTNKIKYVAYMSILIKSDFLHSCSDVWHPRRIDHWQWLDTDPRRRQCEFYGMWWHFKRVCCAFFHTGPNLIPWPPQNLKSTFLKRNNFFFEKPVCLISFYGYYLKSALKRSTASGCRKLPVRSAVTGSGQRTADKMNMAAAAATVSLCTSNNSSHAIGIISMKASSFTIVALLIKTSKGAWKRSITWWERILLVS